MLQRRRIIHIEGGGAPGVDVQCGPLQAIGIPTGEDDVGALGAGHPGGFQPDSGASADEDDGLSEQGRFAVASTAVRVAVVIDTLAICASIGLIGRGMSAICHAELLQGRVVDPGETREWLDGVVQHVQRDVRADGERRLLQPLTGLRSERVGAGQPLAVAEQRQEPVGFGVGVRVGGRLRHFRDGAVALYCASAAPTAAACGSV